MRAYQLAVRLRSFRLEKDDFSVVLFGAGQVLIIRVLASGIGFVSSVLLARWMGSLQYGVYSFAVACMILLAYPATLGLPGAAVRFIAQYVAVNDWQHVFGFMKLSSWLAFGCGILFSTLAILGILFFKSDFDQDYFVPTIVALSGIPIVAVIIVRSEAIRGLGWLALAWGPLQLGQPLLLLITTAVLLLVASQLTATMAVLCSIVAYATNLIAQWGVFRASLGTMTNAGCKGRLVPWLGVALPFVWISLANVTLLQAGVIVVGMLLTPQDAAIYSAAAATSGLAALPLYAAVALGAPRFAALHLQQRRLELQALFSNIVRWTFWPSLAIALMFVACGSIVLRLFGPGFEKGYAALLLLTFGQLVSAFVGPVVALLNMTGHQSLTARVLSTAAVLGVLLGIAFARLWGIVGTAAAFSGAMVLWNAWLTVLVFRKLEILPTLSAR